MTAREDATPDARTKRQRGRRTAGRSQMAGICRTSRRASPPSARQQKPQCEELLHSAPMPLAATTASWIARAKDAQRVFFSSSHCTASTALPPAIEAARQRIGCDRRDSCIDQRSATASYSSHESRGAPFESQPPAHNIRCALASAAATTAAPEE